MNSENKDTTASEDKVRMKSELSLKDEWNIQIKDFNWAFVIFHLISHIIAVYGILTFPYLSHKLTALWFYAYYVFVLCGQLAGAHRLWSHRSYKAKLPLRIILACAYYGAGHFKLRHWVKVHRLHHKYTDTDADPHNINRGFWFAHMGWYLLPKHPEVLKRLKEIDMSDINADPVVNFGDKHFVIVTLLMAFILPTLVPVFFWNESWYWAIITQCFIRYEAVVHAISSINSFSHMFGYKPYDRKIKATNNLIVQFIVNGEGWHNFHHVFPWDYRTGEIAYIDYNVVLHFINLFKKIGWAYDCKQASDELIRKVTEKRSDKSNPLGITEVSEGEN
ncbi:acyl-CoA Delta(11) desaturase-like [Leptopilina heterotoma]|uniref:acyl-CoA Delta(11) desaturase-like n=1 Tax=Leptopilina heterotoma TaxID=63436 RepID=UPI001CA96273|nr:acyl-CoA Delta(11) desaturase-like [Leptopilina heterotoma]